MNVDELNSTGEILAAHEIIERQMNMLSVISLPSQDVSISRSYYRPENPQQLLLQKMMMKLKDRYSMVKRRKSNKELDKSQRALRKLHHRTKSMDELERMADQIRYKKYLRMAFNALTQYQKDKDTSYQMGVQARAHHNMVVK